MESIPECDAALGSANQALGLRIGALFGILCTSALGVAVPFVCRVADLAAISYVRAFAGGVVLATGFVHILGDAIETLENPCLGWPDFPWAMMVTTFATLLTFNFEWLIHSLYVHHSRCGHDHTAHVHHVHCSHAVADAGLQRRSAVSRHSSNSQLGDISPECAHHTCCAGGSTAHAPGSIGSEHALPAACPYDAQQTCQHQHAHQHHSHGQQQQHALPVPMPEGESCTDLEQAAMEVPKERAKTLDKLRRSVQACTLEAGIVFHSVFIGLALGINRSKGEVRSLMVALMFHQLNEGMAIGIMLTEARYRARHYWALGAAFFLTTPVAIAIGIAVSSRFNPSSKAALGTQGVLDATSAGILLYNALVDFIVPTFNNEGVFKSKGGKALGFGCLYLGAGVMCLIAKWA